MFSLPLVSMSFMKSPVGDCHYYAIIKKWTKLQSHALHVLSVSEDLVHQVRYEALLKDNAETMKEINEFMVSMKVVQTMNTLFKRVWYESILI